MSVEKEPSGRRSVHVEVEVPGTPEQVWKAIATGPGISAWFVPTTLDGRVGGSISLDFGGGMVTSAEITAWQPPFRFTAEDKTGWGGSPPLATEWSIEAKKGGTCIVRVVHSLFASTDDWDGQLESTEHGWPGYFRVLRHYLAHHAGEAAASYVLMAPVSDGADTAWSRLSSALGAQPAKVGQPMRAQAKTGAVLAGTVQAVDHVPQGEGVMIVVDKPAPGVVLASAMDCMGMRLATVQAFFYGPRASAAAADQEQWQQWLLGLFPPAAVTPPTP